MVEGEMVSGTVLQNRFLPRMALSCHDRRVSWTGVERILFVRFARPWMVWSCFAFLGTKIDALLGCLLHRDQGGFLHVQPIRFVPPEP